MKRVKVPDPSKTEEQTIDDRFRLVREIGRGAAGIVYEGVQLSVDRRVAIKVLHQDRQNQNDYEERFTREARAIARLSHTNCITLFDFGFSDEFESLYMVMEFIEGKELYELTKDEILPIQTALRVSIQIAEALAHAHRHGILHRDLKPENVLVTRNWEVKVLDFGLARMLDLFAAESGRRLTAQGAVFGTPAYMSPEQCAGELDVTVQSDIYSLGIMLYELFEGRLPFDSREVVKVLLNHAKDPPPPLTRRLPERIKTLIGRMLEKEPTKRPRTATEVADTLRSVFLAMAGDDGMLKPDVSQEIQRSLLKGVVQQADASDEGVPPLRTTQDGLEGPNPLGGERLQTLDLVGHRIGDRYSVGQLLEEDSTGTVFEGTDEDGGLVALRILGQKIPAKLRRSTDLQTEIQTLRALMHANVALLKDSGHDAGYDRMYLVTERVSGDRLSTLCDLGRTPTELAVQVGSSIAAGLAAAHDRGIIHGDIRPASILLAPREDGTLVVKLTRFGLSSLVDQSTAKAARFQAPEQLRGEQADERTDIYALGVVLYQMLSGQTPWAGKTHSEAKAAVLKGQPKALADFIQEVPRPLSDLIKQMMHLNPAQRPATAAEVVDRVDRVRRQVGLKQVRVPHAGASADPMSDWRLRRRIQPPVRDSGPTAQRYNTGSVSAVPEWKPPKSRTWIPIFLFICVILALAAAIIFVSSGQFRP